VSTESTEDRSSNRDGDDFFTGMLGAEVGSKVSGGFWSAMSATKTLAEKAKKVAEERVTQAQNEGWVDAFADTAKQGVGVAVETTTWAAQRGVEAGKTSYTYVNEKGGMEILSKTTEVLAQTATSSAAVAGSGLDWFSENMLATKGSGEGNAAALQGMSSGRMQGFGSDCQTSTAGQAPAVAAPSASSYHEHAPLDARQATADFYASPADAAAPSATPGAKKADIWSDEAWDDWN